MFPLVSKKTKMLFSGELLLAYRKHAKMSRQTLAYKMRCDICAKTIKNYETGEHIPSVNTALRLAEALGVGLEALLDAEG